MSNAMYKQVLPPTGVSHCVSAFFDHVAAADGDSSLPNLIVIKFTHIQVYSVRVPGAKDQEVDIGQAHLELVGEWTLWGCVQSVDVLRTQQKGLQRDSLFLAFRDAKASVVEFDEATNSLRTVSLHSWEDESLTQGRTAFSTPPKTVTDPQGRCAAVAFFSHQLALLPAEGNDMLDLLVQETGTKEGPTLSAALQSSYVVNLAKALNVQEVKDLCFLHRYNAPALLILHEVAPSWPGRYRDRRDTCELVAISLDLTARRHTRVWSATNLPADSSAVSPVPAGGVLVLSTNYLLYYAQESSCVIAVNRHAFSGTIIPMSRADRNDLNAEPLSILAAQAARASSRTVHNEAVATISSRCDPSTAAYNLELDGAVCTWLGKMTVLMSLKSGRLVTVSLKRAAGIINGFAIHGVGTGSPSSCGARLSDDLLFLGSWTGDSLLLLYEPVLDAEAKERTFEAPSAQEEKNTEPRSAKRQKLAAGAELGVGADENADEDDDMDDLYGDSGDTSPKASSKSMAFTSKVAERYNLKVLDSIMCLGPVRDMCVVGASSGSSSSQSDEEKKQKQNRAGLQAVMAVGSGKGGALAITRRGVLPDLTTEVPIPGITGVWALHCQSVLSSDSRGQQDDPHSYLMMALEEETKVFNCGEELEEITDDSPGFITDRTTIAAASLLGGNIIVQVQAGGVRVAESASSQAQDLTMADLIPTNDGKSDAEVLSAATCDSWVAVRLSTGQAALYQANAADKQLSRLEAANGSLQEQPLQGPGEAVSALALYTDSSWWFSKSVSANKDGEDTPVFLLVARAGGSFEIYSLPDWGRVFYNSDLSQGYRVMVIEENITEQTDTTVEDAAPVGAIDIDDRVVEISMECFTADGPGGEERANPHTRPLLMALTGSGNLMVYKAFCPTNADLRFKRLKMDWLAHTTGPPPVHGERPRRIVPFRGLGDGLDMCGFFISGMQASWMVAYGGTLQPHAYQCDGPVSAFTPFHNANCLKGFIVVAGLGIESQLKICELPATPFGGERPSSMRMDQPWVTRKVPLRVTPHKVAHFPEETIYGLLISHMVPFRERPTEQVGGDAHAAAAYATADAAANLEGVEEGHELWVLRDTDFAVVWKHELQSNEQGVSVRAVALKNINSPPPCRIENFFAVGTATNLGEDYPCLGRILLFCFTYDATTGSLSQARLKYEREFRGPVTAIQTIESCLLSAVGSKLLLHYWDGERLTEAAFFDSPLLITSVSIIKNFVLLGDIHKGAAFVRYVEKPREGQVTNPEREKYRQLLSLSKDYDQQDITGTEFIINDKQLGLLTSDGGQSLHLFQYDNQDPDSWRGKRLMPKASFHVGADILCMLRLKMGCETNRRAAMMATTHGSVALFAPLPEEAFVALSKLVALLQRRVEQPCGLNPRAYRRRFNRIHRSLGGGEHYGPPLKDDNALDGDLLWAFQWLSRRKQAKLAKDAGSSRQQILEYLVATAESMSKMPSETGGAQAWF